MNQAGATVWATLVRWRSQAEAWARRITVLKHKAPVLQDSASLGPRFSVWTEWRARLSMLHLTVGASVIRAAVMGRDVPDWAAECTWDSEIGLTDAIARLAADLPRPCRRLTVTLERPLVQLRTIRDLPPVRASVLPRLVAAQDRRFFRRNGRPLVTDAVWVAEHGTRVARAVAVEQPLVEAIADGARAAGLVLVEIATDAPRALSLLPAGERGARARLARQRLRLLAAATAAVWLVAGGLFVGRVTWERGQVEAALAALEEPLAAVREARREIRAAEQAVVTMHTMEAERGRALATLGAIARALPNSVVATSLVWTADGTGVLGGVGRRASEAVRALQQAQAVAQPRLDGHVVRETVAGRQWERFTIIYGTRDAGPGRGRDE